jgi:hypothetical protein
MEETMDSFVHTVLVPLIIAVGGFVLVYLKMYFKKITESTVEKNEAIAYQQAQGSVNSVVQAAIAANMRLAEEYKADESKRLSEQEILTLNNNAKRFILQSLPSNLVDSDGVLSRTMGGKEALEKYIEGLIEKYVTEEKMKQSHFKV